MTHYSEWCKMWIGVGAIAVCLAACGQAQPPQEPATPTTAPASPTASVSPPVLSSTSPAPDSSPLTIASQPTDSCVAPQTQAAMTHCAGQNAKQEDDELNTVYRQLRKELDGTEREQRLIDAQLAWISFRDADCAYVGSQFEGGSLQPQVVNDCIARLTHERTTQLKSYLDTEKQGL